MSGGDFFFKLERLLSHRHIFKPVRKVEIANRKSKA